MNSAEESPFKGKTGWRRLWNALRYSWAGLRAAYCHEDAFRQEIRLLMVLVPLALCLPVSATERVQMISSLLLVLIVELLNSAVEAAIDRIGLENHRLSKRAKDIGSAAVLVALLNVLWVWGAGIWGLGWGALISRGWQAAHAY